MSKAGGNSKIRQERILYVVSPTILLLLWQLSSVLGLGDRRFFPAPTDILERFWELLMSGQLLRDTFATLWRICAGFVLGVIPGVVIGLCMAMWRSVRITLDPLVSAFAPVPKLALMPLLLLTLGLGEAPKIAIVAIGCIFPMIFNTYSGAANIEKLYVDVARNYGASAWIMFSRIVLRGAMPMIFSGLRVALSVSFVIGTAAEFVAAKSGLGYLIWSSWELLDVDSMFVGILTIGLVGMAASAVLLEVERKVIRWKV